VSPFDSSVKFQSLHLGDHVIKQHDPIRVSLGELKSGRTIAGRIDSIAQFRERTRESGTVVAAFHDQDMRIRHLLCPSELSQLDLGYPP
jgi:hypothetical protein